MVNFGFHMINCELETIIFGSNMIIFASKTIKSGREAIWFERDMIIFVPAILFCALDMSIFGGKKTSSRPNTINLLPEKMIVMTEPIVSVRSPDCSERYKPHDSSNPVRL